jgi:hypothetical protein
MDVARENAPNIPDPAGPKKKAFGECRPLYNVWPRIIPGVHSYKKQPNETNSDVVEPEPEFNDYAK